jgi:hypothetical protein
MCRVDSIRVQAKVSYASPARSDDRPGITCVQSTGILRVKLAGARKVFVWRAD